MGADEDGTKAEQDNKPAQNVKASVLREQDENGVTQQKQAAATTDLPEPDEFGLPSRPPRRRRWSEDEGDDEEQFDDAQEQQVETENGDNNSMKPLPHPPEPPIPEATEQEAEAESSRHRAPTLEDAADRPRENTETTNHVRSDSSANHARPNPRSNTVSEWSHQQLAPRDEVIEETKEEEWQAMPAFATHRIYDDWNKVIAKSYDEVDEVEHFGYGQLGGAGKGYTRVQVDDDAESATSMDDDTAYLFKAPHVSNALDEDEEGRDVVSQMQTTKELLTEGQRIAYVGVVRLSIGKMLAELKNMEHTKGTKKQIDYAMEAMKMWGQKMMVRLYGHMEIDSAEQIMVEQLSEHGVLPSDMTPVLMQNARVRNPVKLESDAASVNSARPSMGSPRPSSVAEKNRSTPSVSAPQTPGLSETPPPPKYEEPPVYEEQAADDLTVQDSSQLENNKDIDLDIRWTVLCDLFLLLMADSTYDARSRTLLEHVGSALSVNWQEVCRFEKRVTDALEMQEQADKENWNEDEHMVHRAKAARKKRLMVMGLCTVGGGLVIGLSAGLMGPIIGGGLVAGAATVFGTATTGATATFLGGTGAAALIGGVGATTGGIIGVRASDRRTGAVKTFEYRPLHNNKRPNLIVTVAGWMTGKVDDVRLPFSTVDPIMGDMYSVNWEPEMLQSTGQTIQILATEALTQGLQQVLASTILGALMAGLSLPIVLTKLSYLIDNPWTVSLARADATGLILADSLIDRNLGVRPITLVGFSLGSRVIFSCLKELARRGALGLVQNVYLFGSPIVAKKDEYIRARTVVSGRFVNGYAMNDWILGYLFRATSGGIMRVSGLSEVDVPGIENKDVTEMVPGHMAYRGMMPSLLQEVGWVVDSLEFTEIEDPDPENHKKRQRELINEIEAARHELDEKQSSQQQKKVGPLKAFFSRGKRAAPRKKDWETYDERSQKVLEGDEREAEKMASEEFGNVMFDVDAIRAEALKLALEGADVEEIKRHLQIREIESTLPALKLESPTRVGGGSDSPVNGAAPVLRQTKSYHDSPAASGIGPATEEAVVTNGHVTPGSEPEERVSLSFETSPQPPSSSSDLPSGTSTPGPSHRPSLRSVNTAPSPSPRLAELKSPDHNPWGDEEELGEENGVRMSFE